MKKVLIVFVAVLGFASCSSDDSSSDDSSEVIIADNAELIIGEWSPTRFVFEVDGEIITDTQANSCQIMSRDKYYEDGDLIKRTFGGSLPDDCSSGSYNYYYVVADNVMIVNWDSHYFIEIEGDVLIRKSSAGVEGSWNIHYYKRE